MIGDGYFDKGEEEHFQDRMDNVDKRMQNLLEKSQRDHNKWAWYIFSDSFRSWIKYKTQTALINLDLKLAFNANISSEKLMLY